MHDIKNRNLLRGREDVLSQLYQTLRIADEDEELKDEALKLYKEIEAALIEATREIYEPRIAEARKEENRAKDKED
jgi:hypothetical protein